MSVTQYYKLFILRGNIEKVNRGCDKRRFCGLVHGKHVVAQSGKFGGHLTNEIFSAKRQIVSAPDASNDFAASTLHVVNKNRVCNFHASSALKNGSVAV